jgi:DNA-binding HxlR family transcriptional regulator
MLTQRLAELQALGFIIRDSERGTYRLTEKGETLRSVLQSLYDWGEFQARELGQGRSPDKSLR